MKMATHDPAKKPKKGILKSSSSFDKPESHRHKQRDKEMTWDEMNIVATHHPPDKDYGHMKIDEPPTPYNRMSEDETSDSEGRRCSIGEVEGGVNQEDIASRLAAVENMPERKHRASIGEEESSSDEEETEEQRAIRKKFEQKRKLHYNEFQAVKLAKQLMKEEEELDEEDEADEENGKPSVCNKNTDLNSQQTAGMGSDKNNDQSPPSDRNETAL